MGQKAMKLHRLHQGLAGQGVGHVAEHHRSHLEIHLSRCACFDLPGLVLKHKVEHRDSRRGVTQVLHLHYRGHQSKAVHCNAARAQPNYAAASCCWALRASSRSTDFIMEEGPVSAFFFWMVR